MKRFAILRDLDPSFDWDDMDSAAIQTVVNMGMVEADLDVAWDPRVRGASWIRSFWAPGTSWGLCLYGGADREVVERYHTLCEVPYERIDEVDDVESPLAEAGYPRGRRVPPSAEPLIAVEGPATVLPPSSPGAADSRATGWIRTYRADPATQALAIFDRAMIPAALVRELEAAGCVIRPIVEIAPDDYLELE